MSLATFIRLFYVFHFFSYCTKIPMKQSFRDFVIYGYNQWKPTVIKNFEKIFSSKQQAILSKELNIYKVKPRDLNIDEWLKLFESFLKYVSYKKQAIVKGAESRLKIQQKKLQKQYRTRKKWGGALSKFSILGSIENFYTCKSG